MGIIYELYTRYGLQPFRRASKLSDTEIFFYFLHRHMARKPKAFKSRDAIQALLKEYTSVPPATRTRARRGILSVADRWVGLDFPYHGCRFIGCPEKKEPAELRAKRKRGVRDPVVEERLYKWGGESKACTKLV